MSSRTASTPARPDLPAITAKLGRAVRRWWPKAFFVVVQLIFAVTLIIGIQIAERLALVLNKEQLIGATATVAIALVSIRYTRHIIRGLSSRTVHTAPAALGTARLAGPTSTATQRAVALHEAAHAVVAHDFGLDVLEMSLDGEGNGQTSYNDELAGDGTPEALAFFRRNALVGLAGWVQDRAPSHGSAGDWGVYTEHAYRLVSLGGAASFNDFFEEAVPEVRTILAKHRPLMERLADTLQENGKLGQDEIAAILAD